MEERSAILVYLDALAEKVKNEGMTSFFASDGYIMLRTREDVEVTPSEVLEVPDDIALTVIMEAEGGTDIEEVYRKNPFIGMVRGLMRIKLGLLTKDDPLVDQSDQ